MTQANSPSGRKQGILGALSGLGWPVFIIDEILENVPKIVNGIKEGAWGKVLLGLLIILGALLLSPFLWAFAIPAWLVWSKLGFDLTASLKVGAIGEAIFLVWLGAWVHKKLSRDPWNRALDRAQVILARSPKLDYGELRANVHNALVGTDERALPFADDAASVVMWGTLGGKPHRPWWQRSRRGEQTPRLGLLGIRVRFNNLFAGWLDFDGQLTAFSGPKPPKTPKWGQRRGRYPGAYSPFSINERKRVRQCGGWLHSS